MSYDLELKEGKAILSNKLLTLLEAKPGDRIAIEYGNLNGDLKPIIRKSDSGNLLSKSNSFIFFSSNDSIGNSLANTPFL